SGAAGNVERVLGAIWSDEAKKMLGFGGTVGERKIGEDIRGAREAVAHEVHLLLLVMLPGIFPGRLFAMCGHPTRIQRA
ncbi:MAG: hypothetical protein WAL55_07365, partial [Candidatus Acidiferrales bacterium]